MTNVEKLEEVGILEEVRKRMGVKNGTDTDCDEEINNMTATELVGKWTGWVLGSEQWAHEIIGYYKNLKSL